MYPIIAVSILVVLLAVAYHLFLSPYKYTKSSISGKWFRVRRQPYGDALNKANDLDRVDQKIQALLSILKLKQANDNIAVSQQKNTGQLIRQYVYSVLHEAEKQKGLTSYTVNNSDVYLCLESRDSDDVLFYVTIHELCHLVIGCRDHCEEFWSFFNYLIAESRQASLLNLSFDKPVHYCGLVLFDPK